MTFLSPTFYILTKYHPNHLKYPLINHNYPLNNPFQSCILLAFAVLTPTSTAATPLASALETTEFTPTQYHIQTDEGDERFFRYQTWTGQFRKENRLEDGSVVG